MALMAVALSRDGYQKVLNIMNADEVLKNRGGGQTGGRQGGAARGGRGGGVRFGADEYYIALLGSPAPSSPWLIQFGGHHLAINVTVAGANQVLTPSLPAAQPARYTLNGETIRPLGKENDKGFALINTLTPAQQKQAILNYQVRDLVLGAGADGKTIQPEGILASALNASQQEMLLDLAHEWVGISTTKAPRQRWRKSRRTCQTPTLPGAAKLRTEAWRTIAFRVPLSSSSTRPSKAISTTFTRSIEIQPTTMARS
jgi:hypothetical protein